MATRFGVLAWRIPGTVEPDGLPSVGSHRVGHDWSDLAAAAIILCIVNSKDPTEILLEINNEISKATIYKIKIQKLVVFLYTDNKKSEIELKMPLTIVSKTIKHLEKKLTKEMKDLYTEIYKTLMK